MDVAKCLAAFLVVAIHADFPGMFGKYVNAWARIAGPLFFIISGYYYPILASQGKQKRQIRKLLKYLLIGSTVFIVYECTVAALKGNLSECLNIWITSGTIAKFLFFNAFPFAGHLWYMYALLYVYAILNPNRSLDTPSPFLIGKTRLSGILPASVRILFLATPSARREACCLTQAGNLPKV